jgi:hypothetical protein
MTPGWVGKESVGSDGSSPRSQILQIHRPPTSPTPARVATTPGLATARASVFLAGLGVEYANFPLDHRRMVFDRAWVMARNQVSAPRHSVVGQSSVQHADNHESPNVLRQDNLPRAERPAFDNRLRQKSDGTAALDAVR